MKYKALSILLITFSFSGCDQPENEAMQHEDLDAIKVQYVVYSNEYELFAESDPFVAGESANVLCHFSTLTDFKPVENGKITATLVVNGKEFAQSLDMPTRRGIYSFDFRPQAEGKGTLKFKISNDEGLFEITVLDVTVFASIGEAKKETQKVVISKTNTAVFTKEQSWKIDYSTGHPEIQPFGQVIRTAGLVQSAPGNEMIVTAKTSGLVSFTGNAPLEGMEVTNGQTLFYISGGEFAYDNFSVKYTEAKNNYAKAKADFERFKILAEDKIIAEKDFLNARKEYENTKAIYDNLSKNFSSAGQIVKSPMTGFIKQILIKNGSYVAAGQPVLTVSQDKTLVISAEVPQKYASLLGAIQTVIIRNQEENKTWTLEELHGKVLSFGKSTGPDSYLVPINLEINNPGTFLPGGIVELFLKTLTNATALTVPNSALIEEQGNFYVWIQITPELFEKREITVGKTDGMRTEILDRLSISERIVTKGAMMVKLAQATGTLDAHSGHVH
jgi:RND family efflux transporter MFP subunit